MGHDVGGAPDKMIVDVAAVNVRGHDKAVFAMQDFSGQLLSNLVRLFGADFPRSERLNQVPPDCVSPCPRLAQVMLELKPRRMGETVFGMNQKAVVGLGGIADVLYRVLDSSSDRYDFSNRHISSTLSFTWAMSLSKTLPVALTVFAIWLTFTPIAFTSPDNRWKSERSTWIT
jgi:hypothetical protein